MPQAASLSATIPEVRVSSNPISGWEWRSRRMPTSSSANSAMRGSAGMRGLSGKSTQQTAREQAPPSCQQPSGPGAIRLALILLALAGAGRIIPVWPRPEAFREKINERAHLGREVTRVRIDGAHRRVVGNVSVENTDQCAGLQMAPDEERRLTDHAEPRERRSHEGIAVVGAQAPVDRDRPWPPVRRSEMPFRRYRDVAVAQALVGLQVVGRIRNASRLQIAGARAYRTPNRCKLARHQARVLQLGDAHGEVEAFVDEIDEAVVHDHVDVDLRIAA